MIFKRNKAYICSCCEYVNCVSNNSPCYNCRRNSQFELEWNSGIFYTYDELIIDPLSKKTRLHIVQKGDTLTSIANKYNTTVGRLVYANGIKNKNYIREGDRLIIY